MAFLCRMQKQQLRSAKAIYTPVMVFFAGIADAFVEELCSAKEGNLSVGIHAWSIAPLAQTTSKVFSWLLIRDRCADVRQANV